MGYILLIIVVFVAFGIVMIMVMNSASKARGQKLDSMVSSIDGFTPSRTVLDYENRYRVLVDDTSKRVCIITNGELYVFEFDKIISVELIEDGKTISSKSAIRTIGGALVGGVLAGGAGAIVGGLSGKTKTTTKISSISVKVMIRDFVIPSINIVTFDYRWTAERKPLNPDNMFCNIGINNGKEIVDIISVAIDEADRSRNEKVKNHNQPPRIGKSENISVADEIKKLAELKEKGYITEEEFQSQKQSLLSQRA